MTASMATAVPPDLPPGRYTRHLGLYELRTGQRLRLPDGASNLTIGSVPIGAPLTP